MGKITILVTTYVLVIVSTCLGQRKFIELSHGFDLDTIVFPGGKPFTYLKQYANYNKNGVWYAINDFATAEHCGTHMDAPYHFNKNGRKIGEIPLERLFVNGILINATIETGDNWEYKLPVEKLIEWEKVNGKIKNNTLVIVCFGWSKRYPNKEIYLGSEKNLKYPGLSAEAATWIANNNNIVGVGVDSPSVDESNNVEVHIILSAHDIYNLENVNLNLPESLPPRFDVVVMPMKLMNGTGAPCRITAIL